MTRESEKDLPPKLHSIDQYRVWKVRMTLHFKSHLIWDLVGTTPIREEPAADAPALVKEKYEKGLAKAHSDLFKCLGGNFVNLATTYTTAKEIWDALSALGFGQRSWNLQPVRSL